MRGEGEGVTFGCRASPSADWCWSESARLREGGAAGSLRTKPSSSDEAEVDEVDAEAEPPPMMS